MVVFQLCHVSGAAFPCHILSRQVLQPANVAWTMPRALPRARPHDGRTRSCATGQQSHLRFHADSLNFFEQGGPPLHLNLMDPGLIFTCDSSEAAEVYFQCRMSDSASEGPTECMLHAGKHLKPGERFPTSSNKQIPNLSNDSKLRLPEAPLGTIPVNSAPVLTMPNQMPPNPMPPNGLLPPGPLLAPPMPQPMPPMPIPEPLPPGAVQAGPMPPMPCPGAPILPVPAAANALNGPPPQTGPAPTPLATNPGPGPAPGPAPGPVPEKPSNPPAQEKGNDSPRSVGTPGGEEVIWMYMLKRQVGARQS